MTKERLQRNVNDFNDMASSLFEDLQNLQRSISTEVGWGKTYGLHNEEIDGKRVNEKINKFACEVIEVIGRLNASYEYMAEEFAEVLEDRLPFE